MFEEPSRKTPLDISCPTKKLRFTQDEQDDFISEWELREAVEKEYLNEFMPDNWYYQDKPLGQN